MTTDEHHAYFRHLDGGLYRFIAEAHHSDDASEMIVYEHLWPFTPSIWVRPAHEFNTRFSPITEVEVKTAMQNDQKAAQDAVNQAKASRRQG